MITSTPADPALAAALVALGQQRDSLATVLDRLDSASRQHVPRSVDTWIGAAERAHESAVADLADAVAAARTALDRARQNTSTAIDELNARV